MDEGKTIHQANLNIALWIRENRIIENDEVDPGDDKIIIGLLDYYDLVADSAVRGIVDREMIVQHLGGRMRSAYHLLEMYIEGRRKKLQRPNLYKPFEEFVANVIKDRSI